ncbi:unnamed protein product [Acanthoscelides obtectus]|uniref:Uncharacterized protein n=1 Tax=Acanthoscelides obtectus TaxID=200917 RepID=A0A9P0MN80_ACAOB|nr:unnamed protein product [Acanthoscelides obtectus]CAK1668303.1 Calreticulin [Acanthoscelides obtectus]
MGERWIYSKHPGKEFGKFVRTAGKFFNNEEKDKGKFPDCSIVFSFRCQKYYSNSKYWKLYYFDYWHSFINK